ncbi:Crp/Fnr family transcriptional regulator [Arsenicibacter rosenii]|uniref:Cyclic nucleotide-binding protein n=1 Tax=Arsenicibacter rosenii TaxID=1750698 RepID=A0A1S2VA23_9BACT|nr:cyclic nucleotide-binding domain-containing protein [Arsenicibacter rosenii]OIN55587.1 cyclic nucleotide-binding protein [Arsenicibacter rosenii]
MTASERTALKRVTDAIRPLPDPDWQAFEAIWHPFTARRKVMLTEAGTPEKYLYFVLEGVQRVYYLDELHREATIVFSYPPSFGGVVDSFMLRQPSRYYFETLTPSVFLRASSHDLTRLMAEFPAIESMIRLGLTHAFSGILERLAELQCYSSADKFRKLLQRSPHILQLVPHRYLANYIGVDPTNFSKLINSVKL